MCNWLYCEKENGVWGSSYVQFLSVSFARFTMGDEFRNMGLGCSGGCRGGTRRASQINQTHSAGHTGITSMEFAGLQYACRRPHLIAGEVDRRPLDTVDGGPLQMVDGGALDTRTDHRAPVLQVIQSIRHAPSPRGRVEVAFLSSSLVRGMPCGITWNLAHLLHLGCMP